MKQRIAIKYCGGLVVNDNKCEANGLTIYFVANLMHLGFVISKDLFHALDTLSREEFSKVYEDVIPILKQIIGDNVKYTPMYPNFPQQVMDASGVELFVNAIMHYWSAGTILPEYKEHLRSIGFEQTKFKELGLVTEDEFAKVFTNLCASNDSISAGDKGVLDWFMANYTDLQYPSDGIPFKENMCYIAKNLLVEHKDISGLVKTATDILRIATALSDGDISLSENTKFVSLPKGKRRILVKLLEGVIREEDIDRHRNKWIKLFHNLHVGDFSQKVYEIAKVFRSNGKVESFNSSVEQTLKSGDTDKAIILLLQRPGEFARRLDHVLRLSSNRKNTATSFLTIVDEVPTRILLQLLGNLKVRNVNDYERVAFPKANAQKAVCIPRHDMVKIPDGVLVKLIAEIQKSLISRFKDLDDLGKVYIDPNLMDCPVPSQQRSASEGLFQVARGTCIPLGDKNTLRFFIYWKGQDIDLSATLHDENFNMIEDISYTNLRSHKYQACHSGDVTYAPNGASEFIDITIDEAVACNARYVAMNVFVYSGPTFAEHEICYAGWMTRDKPQSNEIYDPKTVEQKIDLRSNVKNAIPVVFDLVERKAIWADLTTRSSYGCWGNNTQSNRASIEQTLKAIAKSANKVSLYELFLFHATARGTIVEAKEDADTVFSMYDGTITPYNITEINAEYIK